MKTKIIKIDPQDIDLGGIRKAARIIKKGGIVAFPTETVYGLAADYSNEKAVERIFAVKKRPKDKPLTVQIEGISSLHTLADDIPVSAYQLMSAFWPGPLTMVLKARASSPAHIKAGQEHSTVGVRIPDNKIAQSLIREGGRPIVAPSANISGGPEAKEAEEVLKDFDGLIEMVIDGGRVELGVPSTVIDLTQTPFAILREGAISRKDIQGAQN